MRTEKTESRLFELTLEQGREALLRILEERRDGASARQQEPAAIHALELYSALAAAEVSVETCVDLVQAAVECDPAWDLREVTWLVYDARAADLDSEEIVLAIRQTIIDRGEPFSSEANERPPSDEVED